MIDTMVCAHGWPTFDKDPCPDCLRVMEGEITAAVTFDPELEIPPFLTRDKITGKVCDSQPITPQTPVGGTLDKLTSGAPTYTMPVAGQPGYVTSEHGEWTEKDAEAVAKFATEQAARTKNKASTRLLKAGFVKGSQGEYRDGKRWDTRNARWI
jgi:hypothetical protein